MRDGLRALSAVGNRLYHWGLKPVARSTFAGANNSRPVGFFKDHFAEIYGLCAQKAPKHRFRFKCKLYSLDATVISLCLSLFPWATFRKNKAGVKMNTVLDHDGYVPVFADISKAKSLSLPQGSIVTFDKGYINCSWFRLLGEKSIFFATREVTSRGKTLRLRRVGYRDAETGKRYEFLTNHFHLSARTIADIYKERWRIEIFLREIKQNLRITRNLLGTRSLEELLNPRTPKNENPYYLSLLGLAA